MVRVQQPRFQRYAWLLLILLVAVFLRLHDLDAVPPGMTHDEADHGLDAWGVVQGMRPIYFTVGYGREPLYDYSTAVLMAFLGPSYLAGRLTAVFFSLLLLAGTYAWVRRAFTEQVALLTLAGLAVSFWPLMTARHALRTVTMPALFVLAFVLFWKGVEQEKSRRAVLFYFLPAGLLLGLTFYTYFPARIMWVLFPALLVYRWLHRRSLPWQGLLLLLLVALVVAAPLFSYLVTNPGAEARLDQLSGPLDSLQAGEWRPLLRNSLGGFKILTLEGDSLWRYNIPGRPLLPPLLAVLFYGGLALSLSASALCLWRRNAGVCRQAEAHFVAVAWFLGGLAPALITGPEASTTRVAAMQPVLYLFPALALAALGQLLRRQSGRSLPLLLPLLALPLYGTVLAGTVRGYFQEWAGQAEVRIQYEANLVETIQYLNHGFAGPVAVSTDAPDRFHDPSTARMVLTNEAVELRWFNGQSSLLLPQQGTDHLAFTSSAPLHPALARYLADAPLVATLPARGAETNQPIRFYTVDGSALFQTTYPQFQPDTPNLSPELSTERPEIVFGDAVAFLGYHVQNELPLQPGDRLQLATLWQVKKPLPEPWILFSHLSVGEGEPLAQADRLDVPSVYWHPGDVFIQLHEIILPSDLEPDSYALTIGFYTLPEWWQRLPLTIGGQPAGDILALPPIPITR